MGAKRAIAFGDWCERDGFSLVRMVVHNGKRGVCQGRGLVEPLFTGPTELDPVPVTFSSDQRSSRRVEEAVPFVDHLLGVVMGLSKGGGRRRGR